MSTDTWHRVTGVDHETSTGTCSRCGLVPVAFVKNSRGFRYALCRIAQREVSAKRRKRISGTEGYRAYHREYRRRTKFNLSPGGVEDLITSAGFECAICREEVTLRSAHIDHDHACCADNNKTCGECIRGVLCSSCNTGLGMFRDDPRRLLAAVEYLKEAAK